MLCPNNRQKTKLFECAGTARFVYNWVLDYEHINYGCDNSFINDYELRKRLTELKKTHSKFTWLSNYSNNIAKQAVKDACKAYLNFFKGTAKFPNYKSRRKSKPSFYVDPVKICFTDTHVKLEKLTMSLKANKQKFNYIRLAEKCKIPVNAKYSNPRVTFDGLNWWISVGIEVSENIVKPVCFP